MIGALLGQVVEWGPLGETVASAIIAGTVVTLTFSIAIYGMTRSADLRRDGRPFEAAFAGLLGGVALVLSLAAVTLGLIVMVS